MKTTVEAGKALAMPRRTVQWYCRKLGIPKTGRDYLLTDDEIKKIESARTSRRPGRPAKS